MLSSIGFFIIVKSLLITIAREDIRPSTQAAFENHTLYNILYVNDTIILGLQACHVDQFAAAVCRSGQLFDTSPHWCNVRILRSDYRKAISSRILPLSCT